jgi:hypothetical protein
VAEQDGTHYLRGWTCRVGHLDSIAVHLYVGGAYGKGIFAKSVKANVASEDAVNHACQTPTHLAHRFSIPLDDLSQRWAGQRIWLHAIDPVSGPHPVLPRPGEFAVPAYQAPLGPQPEDPQPDDPPTRDETELLDVLANNCHVFINGLDPMRYTSPSPSGCTGQRAISTTHETDSLGHGDMFALDPPLAGSFDPTQPWNVDFQAHALDLGLDNRQARFANVDSHNGRPISSGHLGTFLNIDYNRPLSKDTTVEVVFDDHGSQLDGGSAARVTMGFLIQNSQGTTHWVEVNLRVAGSWERCTGALGPGSQPFGTPLGLADHERCDPSTGAQMIDYRSYNPRSSELVYFNGRKLLAPTITGSRYSYQIPISALHAAFPWKELGSGHTLEGMYFGIEHYHGASTRIVARRIVVRDHGPHRQLSSRMRHPVVEFSV